MSDELPPLPTKIRFEARYRTPPKGRPDVSLAIFFGLLAMAVFFGYKTFAEIGTFLTLARQNAQQKKLRATPAPAPDEVPVMIQDRP
jgi:hypothetical protein